MNLKGFKKKLILGILFLLPVAFLLLLYPAQHYYKSLDILKEDVADLNKFTSQSQKQILLKDHLSVLGFLGKQPKDKLLSTANLNELIYSKFKGFKKFQIVMVVNNGTEQDIIEIKKELSKYDDLKYWHFVSGSEKDIIQLYNSIRADGTLDNNLSTDKVFIIDKELKQRGRLDDRTDGEIETNKPIYSKTSYDCIQVADLKNEMSQDLRVLFTEYRQKRKGNYNSDTRREQDLKGNHEEN